MGALTYGLMTAGNAIANSAGYALNKGVNKLFGIEQQREQLEQQGKLQNLQIAGQKQLADYGQGLQKDMYDYTYSKNTPEVLKNLYKDAGLNVGLAMGGGASNIGGSTGNAGTGSVSGASASDAAALMQSQLGLQNMNLQNMKLSSEIAKIKSDTALNDSKAGNEKQDLKLKEQLFSETITQMQQSNVSQYLQNAKELFNMDNIKDMDERMRSIGEYGVNIDDKPLIKEGSYLDKKAILEVANIAQQNKLIDSNIDLNDNKIADIIADKANKIMHAKAAESQAATMKSQVDFATGKDLNWKSFDSVARMIVQLIVGFVK